MAVQQQEKRIGFKTIQLYKDHTLGIGSYGKVCKAECDGLLCAAKVIHETLFDPTAQQLIAPQREHRLPMRRFEQECQFLSTIRHPNIIQYLGMYQDPDTHLPVLLMELMDDSLTHFLESSPQPIPYHIQVNICHDITLALSFLHSNGIVHRDLSSNNVLMIGNIQAKVTDFGMARLGDINPQATHLTFTMCPGTEVYMPPEAVKDKPVYTKKIDCFSFGVITVQIMTRLFPQPGDRRKEVEIENVGILEKRISEHERRRNHIVKIDPNNPLLAIALSCLQDNDAKRPNSQELCKAVLILKGISRYGESIKGKTVTAGQIEIEKLREQHRDELLSLEFEKNREIETLRKQLEQLQKDQVIAERVIIEKASNKLVKLCREGNIRKIIAFLDNIDLQLLGKILTKRNGIFGYTVLHEAVVSGKPEVLKYLLDRTGNTSINYRTNCGDTPLHLAARLGHARCVQELLACGADISCVNEYGKTPKQTAKLCSKSYVVKILCSEEIIKEAENNGDKITELLKNGNLEAGYLDRALKAAVKNDNHLNIGNLVMKGAKELKECLQYSKDEKKPHARAMLLLIIAAQTGDRAIVQKLYAEWAPGLQNKQDYEDDGFGDVQKAVLSGNISTFVPIEIARRNEQSQVRKELLLKTDVNQEEGYVYWHGLRLLQLDIAWLRKIAWVKKLTLAENGFRSLPPEIATYLKQVVKIDLQHNDLTTIPKCLLELPSLGELNLSSNKLTDIPDVAEWSPCLTVLDLSNNQLNNLPLNVVAPAIHSLNLAKNQFRNVPLCICSFTTLHSLTLSENSDIMTLPSEMGRLSYLSHLNLSGLKDLNNPPKNLQKECRDCIRYLNSKLRSARGFYRMKLMLVGYANCGKTTLVARLQGKECGDRSTVGVNASEWWYRPSIGRRAFLFNIWDFGGEEEYYATHQCFLSQRSLYLLVFNLKRGDKNVGELRSWLNNIALRAPHSCVIIIGTHLDEVPDEERGETDALLHRIGSLAASYNKLQIMEVLPVGLKNRIENIGLLKEAIYNHAANYKNRGGQLIMGQKIPASYHALDKQLETIQQEVRQGIREPIMHAEEFRTMVHRMNLADIQDDEELKTATLFLTDVGSLLHFDDCGHNLHELYFVDPCWLCDIMSKVVTIKERNTFIKSGILHIKDIPMLFKDKQFPWQYFEQYLTLLDRFEIALPLDNQRVLIPSMLHVPDERPKEFEDEKPDNKDPVYSRFVMFSSANTPPRLWSHLLSRILHSVPKVFYALDKSAPALEPSPISPNHYDAKMSFSMHPMTPTEAFDEVNTSVEVSLNTPFSGAQTQPPASTPSSAAPFFATPNISHPLPFISSQHPFINAPQLLPNFPKPLPSKISDPRDIHLKYWRAGLFYKDSEIMFRIESLLGSKQFKRETRDGVLVIASANNSGKKIICQLVDLVVSLISEWYPGLQEGKHGSNSLEQMVPCFECIKQGRAKPFEFKVERCLPIIAKNETTMECGYLHDDPSKNHTVSLADIVPDLLLQDINLEFLLGADEINYKEDDTSLLGKGGYGKVYRGKCKGKSVAIKKYLSCSEEALTELRSEAKLLQQSHHPCLVCLIGVCVHPLMALVLEEAPLKSLEFTILKKKIPVHRLTIFRIAAEVAAALHFLHGRGIIFRDLKAANILLWSLDPDSLCHCKVANFGIASHLAPIGARGLQGTKGFIAPEVLRHIGKRKQRSVYDHRADIFSFGMFLYQIIARRYPYHNIPAHRIDVAVASGKRPKLQDVNISRTGYHYLTQVMQACWEDNPKNRFDTDTIIKKVCQLPTQMVMCVAPINGMQSFCRSIAIPSNFAKAGHPNRLQSELWVCCDGAKGIEISTFNTHSMVEVSELFIKDNQVQCMALCGDHVWVGSRAGIEYGVIDIFSVGSRELVHNIRMRENSVSCITATEKAVYLGTLEGYCLSFYNDISGVCANVKPRYKYISEHAVDGIVCTQQCVWVAHTRYVYFLNFDNLALEGSIHREKEREAYIGQLSFDPDSNIIWSAHLGGMILSAWDAHNKCHMYDVDTGKHLKEISPDTKDPDLLITAMTPALDTVWVGMASGHIMVFHEDELLSWFHPYDDYVRFLTCIPSAGPCEMEKAIVASGGKGFQPLVEGLDQRSTDEDETSTSISQSGTVIMWEAYEAKTMRQVKILEENSPHYLDNHNTVRRTIRQGQFRDGTHIKTGDSADASASYYNIAYTPDKEAQPLELSQSFRDSLTMHNLSLRTDSLNTNFSTDDRSTATTGQPSTITREGNKDEKSPSPTVVPEVHVVPLRTCAITTIEETFNVKLPDSEQTILVRCDKPVKLRVLLSEVQVTVTQDECRLEYYKDGKMCKLVTQEQLDEYLRLPPMRPQLCVAVAKHKAK